MPTFTGPPSAPMLPSPETPAAPDDIADPVVPAAVLESASQPQPPSLPEHFGQHEALLQGFCQHLEHRLHTFMGDEHTAIMKTLDATLVAMKRWVDTVCQQNEHAQYTLGDALTKLQTEGLAVIQPPYQVRLQVETAAGYPMELTLTKSTAAALIEELGRLEPWLQQSGYKPGSVTDYA